MKLTRSAFYEIGLGALSVAVIALTTPMASAASAAKCEGLFYSPNEQIAMTGIFPPENTPTLRELLAPSTPWSKSGKHANLLTRIYADRIGIKQGSSFHPEDFVEYGEPLQLSKTILHESLAVLQKYKVQLQEAAEQRLTDLLQKGSGQTDLKEIRLNAKPYKVLAKLNLPDSVESDVYLVEHDGRRAVIKEFVDSRFPEGYSAEDAFRAHRTFYEALGGANFRFARPVEIDLAQRRILFEFRSGLNFSILKKNVDEKRLPDEVFKSYILVQAVFANTLIRTMNDAPIGQILKKQNYLALDPHANNCIYNPWTGEWIVIDPY